MSILNVVKKYLPSFGRRDVRDKLRLIASKIADHILGALALTRESIGDSQLKSTYAKNFFAAFAKYLPSNLRGKPNAYYNMLEKALQNAQALSDLVDDYVGKHMGEAIHIEGITYQKASILRLIQLLDFFSDYASRQLAALVMSESNVTVLGRGDGPAFSKAEMAYLAQHQGAFFQSLELLYEQPKVIMAKLEKIPEILVEDAAPGEVDALAGASGDPLNLGIIPLFSDIFTFIGIRKVDYDLDRFERLQKEARLIAQLLEAKRAGNPDARQQKIIENYERELILVRQKISVMEDSLR